MPSVGSAAWNAKTRGATPRKGVHRKGARSWRTGHVLCARGIGRTLRARLRSFPRPGRWEPVSGSSLKAVRTRFGRWSNGLRSGPYSTGFCADSNRRSGATLSTHRGYPRRTRSVPVQFGATKIRFSSPSKPARTGVARRSILNAMFRRL